LDHQDVDVQALQVFRDWINELPSYPTFGAWQVIHFGSTNDPNAAAAADPDGDGAKNQLEYLTGTDPNNPADAWKRDGLLNRFSLLVPSDQEALQPIIASGRQMIVKPNLSSNSRGITILPPGADRADYTEALQRGRQASFDGQAIVEEFFEGREFTVEMLGDGFGNVSVYVISVQYHSKHAGPNKVANKLHYNSAAFSDETYERIADYGRRCYRSLGLHLSLGHLEILMREDGLLSPVEIGARSGGFIASPLTKIASGRDFLGDYMRVLEGAQVNGDGAFYKSSISSLYCSILLTSGESRSIPFSPSILNATELRPKLFLISRKLPSKTFRERLIKQISSQICSATSIW